jgi:meiotic recombination protein DMC1
MESKRRQSQLEEEIEEEEGFEVHDIEKLQEYGINMSDIKKLKASGFCTVMSLLMATKKQLCKVKGISEQKIEKIQECAMKLEKTGFQTGYQFELKRSNILRISTGSSNLDNLLGGGVESMSITEAFGEFRSGKTQLCHTLCVTAQLPKKDGGGGGKVIFIDTEGTFRPENIRKIAERYNLDPEETLNNIVYGRVYTTELQSNLLTLAAAKMMEDKFSLLIIDSIMALFRVDFSGRGQLSERQQVLNQTLSQLMKLAEQFNVAIFITNQVMSNPGATMSFTADPKVPVGGHVLAHASTTRLYLRKGKDNERVCKIYDSPCLPSGEAVFCLTNDGIDDPE